MVMLFYCWMLYPSRRILAKARRFLRELLPCDHHDPLLRMKNLTRPLHFR